ncbi:hypothetical protein ACTI_27410 [Actinoplanes sp. OR16]|uniref:hypothetical protein n=1 Tax=Actinoplanes sp. OR16 TaxID=946334 RepID=UPI000F71DB93|nr:hypothetical protein [Actinoplanes sp. OR16]BBH66056.1 hypothetical protein ACTI_27410 [Actinoplanes sp. OR16]
MNPDVPSVRADTDDLHRQAAATDATADRVLDAARSAPEPDQVPRWAATTAALLAAESARQQLTQVGRDVAETALRIRVSAAAYQEADARAAARFRLYS